MISKLIFICFILASTCSAISLQNSLIPVEALNCPAGYYCTADDRTRSVVPQPCPPGTFSGIGASGCTPCTLGYWTVRYGSAYCDVCPIAHFCANPSLHPTPCPLGSYNPTFGQSDCFPCGVGNYTSGLQSPACAACPHGHYCIDAAEPPKPCPPGNHDFANNLFSYEILFLIGTFSGIQQTTCTACAAGYYNTRSGASQCIICPPGHYCADASVDPVPCPEGTAAAQHGQTSCTPCSDGSYTDTPGEATCHICPAGSQCSNATMSPVACEIGEYSNAGQVSCTVCADGYYTTLTGSTYCNICGPGKDLLSIKNIRKFVL